MACLGSCPSGKGTWKVTYLAGNVCIYDQTGLFWALLSMQIEVGGCPYVTPIRTELNWTELKHLPHSLWGVLWILASNQFITEFQTNQSSSGCPFLLKALMGSHLHNNQCICTIIIVNYTSLCNPVPFFTNYYCCHSSTSDLSTLLFVPT